MMAKLGDRVSWISNGKRMTGKVVLVIPCPLGYDHYQLRVRGADGKTHVIKTTELLPR